MTTREGGCLCGDVRIEVAGDPVTQGICHCRQCQRNCGGSAATFLIYPAQSVTLTQGELRYFDTVGDGGSAVARGFCPNCGTPIMSSLEHVDAVRIVKLGAFDDPSFFKPEAVFWTTEAHDWAEFPENAVQFEHNPPRGG